MKSFCLLLLSGVLLSCGQQERPKSLFGEAIDHDYVSFGGKRIFPIKMVDWVTWDSAWFVKSGETLYSALNMHFCSYSDFVELLIKKVETDGFIFAKHKNFKYFSPVKQCSEIDSLYQKEGINGLLKRYVSSWGFLSAPTREEEEYLVYLLYQHRILCFLGEEVVYGIYVDFSFTGKEKEYLKLLAD